MEPVIMMRIDWDALEFIDNIRELYLKGIITEKGMLYVRKVYFQNKCKGCQRMDCEAC